MFPKGEKHHKHPQALKATSILMFVVLNTCFCSQLSFSWGGKPLKARPGGLFALIFISVCVCFFFLISGATLAVLNLWNPGGEWSRQIFLQASFFDKSWNLMLPPSFPPSSPGLQMVRQWLIVHNCREREGAKQRPTPGTLSGPLQPLIGKC